MGRLRRTSAQHHAVVSADYADFAVGDTVRVREGLLGVITAVEDGPYPGTEAYEITLADGMGGGTWGAGEVFPAGPTTAALSEQQQFANGVADTYQDLGGESLPRYVASEDYPELVEILVSRPPLPHSEPMRMWASKTASSATGEAHLFEDPDGQWWWEYHDEEYGSGAQASGGPFPTDEQALHACRSTYSPSAVQRFRGGKDAWGRPLPYLPWEGRSASKQDAAVDWDEVYPVEDAIGEESAWDDYIRQNDQGSGCDDIAAAIERDFGLQPQHVGTLEGAEQHVLISTSGLWERVRDTGLDILNTQMSPENRYYGDDEVRPDGKDWCRFRQRGDCFFPKELDSEGTKQAGYAVWVPHDRGPCPRVTWNQQQHCPVGEPGPDSGDPRARVQATERWSDGGQRIPEGFDAELTDQPYRFSSLDMLAHLQKQTGLEFTAAWRDVQAKAKRIRQSGGVRIISAPRPGEDSLTVTAEVNGDEHVYETTLLREPGRRNVASWSCGCSWAAYSWGRSGRWKKYEGRMCSHALAVQYEAQAQGMYGGQVTEQPSTPPWRVNSNPFQYAKPPKAASRVGSLRPVCLDGDLAEAPLSRITRESTLSREAKVMLFQNLKALVRGTVRSVKYIFSDQYSAMVDGMGEAVPVQEILYPTYHPTLGLSLSHRASLTAEAKVGEDLFLFEPHGLDPLVAERIDIGTGRDEQFGYLGDGMNADDYMTDPAFLTAHPEGFTDALAEPGQPWHAANLHEEPEPALPRTEADDDEDDLMAVAHTEALIAEAATDPQTSSQMAEIIGESLASSPPSPGDPRLAWLMSGSSAGAASGAGGGSPQSASNADLAAVAKAHLAKVALKEFTPAEQQEILSEGLDVQAANLGDLDIAGTHYSGLEEAFVQAEASEDEEDLFS